MAKSIFNSEKFWAFIIVAIISIWAYNKISNEFSWVTDSSDKVYTKLDAYTFAISKIKTHLKSPSSAKFPSPSIKQSHVTSLGENKFSINSWVESKNSLGTMIKTYFTCNVQFKDDTVSITNIKI